MSSTKPHVRRRVLGHQDPSKISTTMNHQVSKKSSSVTERNNPSSPLGSSNSHRISRARSPSSVSSFWGEDAKKLEAQSNASSVATLRPEGVDDKVDIKGWYDKKVERDSVVKRRTTLYETQQIMPAPGTTYFQLVVQSDRVLLRDWPRQRFSQKWTRDGGLNPGEKVYNTKCFIDGEDRDSIIYIFGRDIYNKAVAAAEESPAAN